MRARLVGMTAEGGDPACWLDRLCDICGAVIEDDSHECGEGHVVLASHDAGGTVPPMLALAEAFVARGQAVTWLGQPSIEARALAAGCRFVAFHGIPDYQARVAIDNQ